MAKKGSSLLRTQKPRSKHRGRKRLKTIAIVALAFMAVGISWQGYLQVRSLISRQFSAGQTWNIHVASTSEISQEMRSDLQTFGRDNLKGFFPDLTDFAARLKRKLGVSSVTVFRSGLYEAQVSVTLYRAAFILDKSQGIMLSEDFKSFQGRRPESEGLPLLTGLSQSSTKLTMDRPVVELEGGDRKAASLALGLLREFKGFEILPSEYKWDEFRGLSVIISHPPRTGEETQGTEVLLGLPPYTARIERLSGILSERGRNNQPLPARIEMDFDGKAFLKERDAQTGRL